MSDDWIRPMCNIFVKFEEYANDLAADLANLLLASASTGNECVNGLHLYSYTSIDVAQHVATSIVDFGILKNWRRTLEKP